MRTGSPALSITWGSSTCDNARVARTGPIQVRREFSVDRDQRILAAVLRPVVAHETTLGPNYDVAHAIAALSKDEHGADRSGELIVHRQTLETEVANQFFTRLRCIVGLWVGFDYTGGNERFLHVTPAASLGMRVGAFLCDGGRATQPRIKARIDSRVRMNDRPSPVTTNYGSGAGPS